MKDWKDHLAELYKGYSTQQKNKKGVTHKGDTIENFRGKKGFNDVGIPLSPKAAKRQQRNRSNYRYPMHLQRINEQRKKGAMNRHGIIDPTDPYNLNRKKAESFQERHSNTSSRWIPPARTHRMQVDDAPAKTRKIHYEYYSGSYGDDEPERVTYIAPPEPKEPAYKAKVIKADDKIKFKNKLEEAIYNHPNYSKQKF